MKSINLFRGEDGREFEVPEDEQENFQQEMQDIPVSRMEKYRGEDGREFDVPEQERDAFMQEMQGLKIDRIHTVKAGDDMYDVPESEAQGFSEFYRNDPRFDTEREEKAKTIASRLDAPDSPLWAGIKTFFSPKNYAENATLEGVSATSANVLRGVAQAPATIADKLAAVEQFGSRVRELPGAKGAMLMTPYGVMGLAGEGVEAILSLNGKDGGKQYRDLIQKARDYVDGKREEFLGYRNEKGQKATADDFAVTIGGQAVNSVAESYLLTAPKIMQGINGMMQAGGKGLLARMTPTLQTMLYGASTAEGTAGKAEAKGMSNEKAVGVGLLTGTIESALESVSQVTGLQDAMSKNALKEAVARTVWKKAGEVLKDATGEGLTEFGQQAQQGTIEKLSNIDEKSWGQIGMESASAAALGFIAGGSSASAKGIFDSTTPRQGAALPGAALPGDALPDLEVSNEQVRMEQEAQAVGEGERAQRESVLEGEAAQGQAGEGAQPAAMDQPGQDTGGGVRVGDPALAGENRLGFEGGTAVPEPLQIADGVFVEPMEEVAPRQGEKPLPGQSTPLALPQVKIRLASGKQIYSSDPGLAALVEYWYKDRVLFPPAPAGDTGRQDGAKQITDGTPRQGEADPALNASRRAGFQVKPAKRVLINIGRSKDSYRGTIVQILDGQTVRVKIDKTKRSLKNSRAGYADVDVRQLAQFANVVGKQNYLDLMKGMTEEQKKKVEADAKAFKDELIDVGLFLDQDAWKYVDGVKGSKARTTKDDLIKDAYARASDMMGIPLDNHIQRAQALPILQEFHTRMQGSEGLPYDAYAERAARDSERDMADRRASGEFSLADLTPEEMAQADAKLQAQKDAQAQRAEVMRRAAAPIVGTTGDMTDIIPGMEDFTFDDTPLFGVRNEQATIDNAGQKTVNPGTTNGKGLVAIVDESNFKQFQKPAAKAYLDEIKRLGKMEVSGPESTAKLILEHTGVKLFYDENPPDDFGFVYVNDPKNGKAKQVDNGSVQKRKNPNEYGGGTFEQLDDDERQFIGNTDGLNMDGISFRWKQLTDGRALLEVSKDGTYIGRVVERQWPDNDKPGRVQDAKANTVASLYDIISKSNAETQFAQDTGEELPFNMAPEYNVAPEAAGVYNQESSGGADTPRAQEQAAEKTPINTPPWMQERNAVGMDLMDAVSMVYQLTGKFPRVMENLRKTRALGYFDPNTKEIVLWAKIFGLVDDQDRARITKALKDKGFEGEKLYAQEAIEVKALMEKRRKEHQKRPLKVAVHELAHLVDFLPDNTIRRGNILGHVAALKKYLKQAIGPEPGAQGPLSEQEKADLRRRVEREMKMVPVQTRQYIDDAIREFPQYKILGVTPDDIKGLLGLEGNNATPELYDWFTRQDDTVKRDVIVAAMKGIVDERVGEVGNKEYTDKLIQHNRNYTKEATRKRFRELLREETERRRLIEIKRIKEEARNIIPWWRGVESMEQYFEKPEEMYAELMGIFLADPSELQRRSPTVFRAFTGWMEARPEVADAYKAFLDARNMPAEKQAALKIEALKRGMTAEDEKARREADEMARKPGKWAARDSAGYLFHRRSAPQKWALDRSYAVLMEAAKDDAARANIKEAYWGARVSIKGPNSVGRKIQDFEADINSRVAKPLYNAGFDMIDMGIYQELRRVVYELDGKAAPAGVEPATALKLLESLKETYGEERWAILQKAALEFRKIRESHIISNPDLRAMYDKELLEKLDNNVEYVTFQHVPTMQEITQFKDAIKRAKSGDKLLREDVADFLTNEMQTKLGSAIGAKIYKYVGSFGPVANPIVATMTKDDQLLRSAVRNTNKRKIYEFIKESGLDLIREVQYEKNNHGMMVPKMVDDANWKTVVYMQDGQVKGYLANRSLARSLDTGRMDEVVWLKNVLNAESMIRNMFTQLNPFFNLRNNIKDVERSATYIPGRQRMRLLPGVSWNYFPGAGFLLSLQRYNIPSELAKKVLPSFMLNDKMVEWDLAAGRRATRLIQTNTINEAEKQAIELMRKGDTRTAERLFDDVKLARAGMENGILMSHNEQIREDSNADDFTRRLYKNGIVKEDLVTGLNMAARMLGFAKEAVRKVEGWGETGELTTKLATWKYLERYGDKLGIDKNERIIMTRELGGSPDFSERSFSAAYIETITQSFVNASKEGTVSALTAFKERPGEVSAKLLTNVVMPTIVRHMLGSGLALLISKWWEPDEEKRKASQMHSFIQWYYDRMQFVPSYILKNFHSYPVPVKSLEGSDFTAILRMPMDQTSMALSLLVWNTMDALGENMIDYMNRNNPTAAPTVLSRTQNPIREVLNVFASSLGPDAVGEGQLGGLLGVTLGYFSGSNFHDSFRDKDVFNADELISRFTSGAWKPAAKTFAGELSNRLGGSMVKRYSRDDPFRQELPMLGQWLNDPFIQPSLGAFFNVYTGGQIQMERKLGTIKKEFEAPIKVEARMDFEQALREGGKGSLKITKEMEAKQIAGKTYEERIKSQIYREEFYGLLQKHFKNELKRGEIGELIKLGNEKNPLMQSIRMDIMERSRNRSPMETNSPLMEDGKGL